MRISAGVQTWLFRSRQAKGQQRKQRLYIRKGAAAIAAASLLIQHEQQHRSIRAVAPHRNLQQANRNGATFFASKEHAALIIDAHDGCEIAACDYRVMPPRRSQQESGRAAEHTSELQSIM